MALLGFRIDIGGYFTKYRGLAGKSDRLLGAGIDTLSNFENLTGSNLNDTLTGNAGNNVIIGGLGNDVMDGGAGTDTVSYSGATVGVTVNLGLVAAQNTVGAGIDTLGNFENLTGSSLSDILTGNSGNNVIIGGLGNDVMDGGAGTDTASYAGNSTAVTVNLGLTVAQNTVGAGNDTLTNFENLIGTSFNDTLTGNSGGNTLEGGSGNDTLDGAAGTDTVSYSSASSAVTVNLSVIVAQNTIGAGSDTLLNFENLTGSNYNDKLTGNTGNNLILGGLGNDVMDGGAGTDTASYSGATAGVTVNLGLATAQNTVGAGTDTLSNFENLTGSSLNDTLIGNSGNNVMIGSLGNDVMDGGAGTDTASYAGNSTAVTVNLGLTVAQNTVGAGTDTLTNFENLIGTSLNDTLTGNSGGNTLEGGSGNDTLDGAAGTDTVSYSGASSAVTVNLGLIVAQNTGGAGTDTLSNFENLTGSNYNDTLIGNSGNNVITGGLGNDTLDGAAGTDTVSYSGASSAVTVNLGLIAAQNTGGAGTDTLSNFENLSGSGYNDTLTGNSGSNTISGGSGNDVINGGLGNDILNGGAGTDLFVFDTALNALTNNDLISDFSVVDDTLRLDNAIFAAFTTTGNIAADQFVSGAGATALDANDYLIYDTNDGSLYYDADGNGVGARVEFVSLTGIPALTAADFNIV